MERMARRLRLFAVTGLIALSLSVFAGTAAAATGASHNGLIGACNMLINYVPDSTVGMYHAMSVANANGTGTLETTGMWHAVFVSGCPLTP